TARHLTFFEMLGNFSFGDYFKQEAIKLAWEFLTEELELEEERLWVSVFGGDEEENLKPDQEAAQLWAEKTGISPERIVEFGKKENFWAMGPTGPCGPCSEILYDQESTTASPEEVRNIVLDGGDRVLELWNLVFMQFNRDEKGELTPLPQQNIDTGLGLERLAAVIEDADSNFETDLFQPVIEEINDLAGLDREDEETKKASRIIADHVRSATFLLSEGLLPGNEGRGYILRRLIRRAQRWGRKLGFERPFLFELVPVVVDIMGGHYEELVETQDQVIQRLKGEEKQFIKTLDRGMQQLNERVEELKDNGQDEMSGEEVFELYETYGFPVEITREILQEEDITFSEAGVEEAKKRHREKSRGEAGDEDEISFNFNQLPATEFVGYGRLQAESEVTKLIKEDREVDTLQPEEEGIVVLARTPFYGEQGGQVGDTGKIDGFEVEDTTVEAEVYLHHGTAREKLSVGERVAARVDSFRRFSIRRHHTATHLLQAALRQELGQSVMQSGSFVGPDYLRFDFTHDSQVADEVLRRVQEQVNRWIYRELTVQARIMSRQEAEEEGALAFFGEHYGDEVRVISIFDEQGGEQISKEFCGGTHLENTGKIGPFTITDETSVAAGVRRIEARAGWPAYRYYHQRNEQLEDIRKTAKVQRTEEISGQIEQYREKIASLEEELEKYQEQESKREAEELVAAAEKIGGVNLVHEIFEGRDNDLLKQMVDDLRNRISSALILLANKNDGAVNLFLGVTSDLTDNFDAGDIVGELGRLVAGGGGGRPGFAQAGGSNPEGLRQVQKKVKEIIRENGSIAGD
ncbi:MAG: alanine--tRNA ligase, partial [bacterium]